MISESHYWKTDLLRLAAGLKKRTKQRSWSEASEARCEQAIMLGFYSIRKLIESAKLTHTIPEKEVDIFSYKATGEPVHLLNTSRIDELYDLDSPEPGTVSVPFLCNQIIHSFIFLMVFDDKRALAGIFVSSDRERLNVLRFVAIDSIIEIFELVGNDDANFVIASKCENGQWVFKLGNKPNDADAVTS